MPAFAKDKSAHASTGRGLPLPPTPLSSRLLRSNLSALFFAQRQASEVGPSGALEQRRELSPFPPREKPSRLPRERGSGLRAHQARRRSPGGTAGAQLDPEAPAPSPAEGVPQVALSMVLNRAPSPAAGVASAPTVL